MSSDIVGHSPTHPDVSRHTLSLSELEARVAAAGIIMSRRQLMRHCESAVFDAKKFPAKNNLSMWFIAPESVEKGIGDLKALQEYRERRNPSESDIDRRSPTMSDTGGLKNDDKANPSQSDIVRHSPSVSEKEISQKSVGHSPTQSDMADSVGPNNQANPIPTESDAIRPSPTMSDMPVNAGQGSHDLDIFEHPYVLRLETQIEKLERKYEAQVRRTEEIQIENQKQLIELQRMTTIGQSQTLANFMLKAKNYILGPKSEEPLQAESDGEEAAA